MPFASVTLAFCHEEQPLNQSSREFGGGGSKAYINDL